MSFENLITYAYPMEYVEGMQISVSRGNHKLGKNILTINLMPGDEPLWNTTKGYLNNVRGTCNGCCDGCKNFCYAVRDGKFRHNTCIPSWSKNTLIMRHDIDDFFRQVKTRIVNNKLDVVRWHSAGEIPNYNYLLKMVELANEMNDINFYVYTKRFNFIERFAREGGVVPDNLVINLSVWHGNIDGYDFGNLKLNQFIYDDHTEDELKNMYHCPAVDEKGNSTGTTCDECNRCYARNIGTVTCVYDH